ncbi:hypothetical protein G6F37_004276 [Rhizopus arrhizus]|nr:hypothetical protein G6F38_003336 [Rhizopus arrhizus]KAG1160125.1 hypothetical protein G6F37_004276 [Rhizopus arrhizus]
MNSNMLLKEVQSKQDAEDNIKNIISPKLLETVIVFQKNWIFATQFEAYYRNNSYIDESAMTTMMDKYPVNLVAKIKNKTEKGKSWFELSIFWGRFEMLLTGGICGSKMSNDVVPFLGSNVPLKELVEGDSFTSENIYVNCHDDGVKAHFQYPVGDADFGYSKSHFSSKKIRERTVRGDFEAVQSFTNVKGLAKPQSNQEFRHNQKKTGCKRGKQRFDNSSRIHV